MDLEDRICKQSKEAQLLIEAALEAEEYFTLDELEDFAMALRESKHAEEE